MNYQAVVSNGVKLLDRNLPGWRMSIDSNRLNVGSCQDCVLAQLYGVYTLGIVALGLGTHNDYNVGNVEKHGFTIFGDYAHDPDLADKFHALTNEWKQQLTENKHAEEDRGVQRVGDGGERPRSDAVVPGGRDGEGPPTSDEG